MNILNQWAGHFQAAGSDKVWAVAYSDDGQLLSRWGRRGAALQSTTKLLVNQEAAAKEFYAKVKKKQAEGYCQVPFDDTRYGLPSFGPTASQESGQAETMDEQVSKDVSRSPVYQVSYVTPLSWEQLQASVEQETYGITEKINGERCLVAFDGCDALTSYNRAGTATAFPPLAAQALKQLTCQFVVDGERLAGEGNGEYVVFDVLEWQGKDVRSWSYRSRIKTLEQAMQQVGLIANGGATYAVARAGSLTAGLTLLTPAQREHGRAVIDAVLASHGEGVIVRTLDAPYEIGKTRQIRKYKFLTDIDAIVIGVTPGRSTGSVRLGLIRPVDGAIIEIGHVRSGLNDEAIMLLSQMLRQGEQPVLTVEYLPIRTTGITLVEPKTSMQWVRTDKSAAECTTDQFGPEKASLIAAAKAVTLPLLP